MYCQNCGAEAQGNFCAQCGHSLNSSAKVTSNNSVSENNSLGFFADKLGIKEFVQILLTVHVPLRRMKNYLASGSTQLMTVIIAYIEMITIIPIIHKKVIISLGQSMNYPLIAQGAIFDTEILFYVISAISGVIGLAIVYLLPKNLLAPANRINLFAINLQIGMYTTVYMMLGDIVKLLIWSLTHSIDTAAIFGWLVIIAVTVFAIYVWRRLLSMSWKAIGILFVIVNVISFFQGYIVAKSGLVHF